MTGWTLPWGPGAVSGVGPLPGVDPDEAARVVFGELGEPPHLPFLPQLPDRGAGADAIGRTAAMLVGLHVDVHAGRWRVVPRSSRDERRARELLERDLDALEEAGGRFPGAVKVQVLGPWTLAATVEMARGEKVLADRGATADLAASLAEGVHAHVTEVRRRLSKASRVLVEVDESLLPDVLRGSVPTASGWSRLRAPEPGPAEDVVAAALEACGDDAGVRCNAPGAPLGMLRRAGARFLALDGGLLETVPEEDVGEAVEAGTGFLVGMVPGAWSPDRPAADETAATRRVWARLGLGEGHWDGVVVTPAVDLSELSPERVVAVLARCRHAARSLQPGADEERPPDEEDEEWR